VRKEVFSMARRDCRDTYRTLAHSQAKVLEARRELEAQQEEQGRREEVIHRYVYPIPRPDPARTEGGSAEMTRMLELLQVQNQLLSDLLGAVSSLTAAVLCRKDPR